MRLALFSDIHGSLVGLRAVLEGIDRLGGADRLCALGDLLLGGPDAETILTTLRDRDALLLRGNAEESVLDPRGSLARVPPQWRAYNQAIVAWTRGHLSGDALALLAGLPLLVEVECAPGRRIALCHAAPADPWARVCSPHAPLPDLRAAYDGLDAAVVAYGHWHGNHVLPLDGKLLVNVASVGLRRDSHSDFTMVEWADDRWIVRQHRVPHDAAGEADLMRARGVPTP